MIALVLTEQPEVRLPFYLLSFPRYSSISGFAVNRKRKWLDKKVFYLIPLVPTEQPEVRLPFYLLPFPRYSSISGFGCKPEMEPFWVLEGKKLYVPQFHPPIVYVYQI